MSNGLSALIAILSVLTVIAVLFGILCATGVISINKNPSQNNTISSDNGETEAEETDENANQSNPNSSDLTDAFSAISNADNSYYGKTCYENYLVQAILDYCNSLDLENAPTKRIDYPDNNGYIICYLDKDDNIICGKAYTAYNVLLGEVWFSPLVELKIETLMSSDMDSLNASEVLIRTITYEPDFGIEEIFYNATDKISDDFDGGFLLICHDENGEIQRAWGASDFYPNGQYKFEYEFVEGGLRTEFHEYNESGEDINIQCFDENGDLYLKIIREYSQNGSTSVEYEYDAYDNLIKKTVHEYNDSGEHTGYIEYDKDGNIINEVSF